MSTVHLFPRAGFLYGRGSPACSYSDELFLYFERTKYRRVRLNMIYETITATQLDRGVEQNIACEILVW